MTGIRGTARLRQRAGLGSATRHDLQPSADLFGVAPTELETQTVTEAIAGRQEAEAVRDAHTRLVARAIDLFRRRPMPWVSSRPTGGTAVDPPEKTVATLKDLGIDKKTANVARRLAELSDAERHVRRVDVRSGLLEPRAEIALLDARIAELLGRVQRQDSVGRSSEAKAVHQRMRVADQAGRTMDAPTALAELGDILERGDEVFELWNQIGQCITLRARLVRTESQRLKDLHQMVPVDQVWTLVAVRAFTCTRP